MINLWFSGSVLVAVPSQVASSATLVLDGHIVFFFYIYNVSFMMPLHFIGGVFSNDYLH
jgi:hypothetical protein